MSKEFFNKLAVLQNELKAPKSKFNSFGNYHYRNSEDILEAVKPLNVKHGFCLSLSDTIELIGNRYYTVATATLTDGQYTHTVRAQARESEVKKGMDDSQISGTASSYARKYALNGLFLIDDTKDADSPEYHEQTQQGAGAPSNGSARGRNGQQQRNNGKPAHTQQRQTNQPQQQRQQPNQQQRQPPANQGTTNNSKASKLYNAFKHRLKDCQSISEIDTLYKAAMPSMLPWPELQTRVTQVYSRYREDFENRLAAQN